MEFSWSPEQQELYQSALRFAQVELGGDGVENDQANVFPKDLWRRCAEFGVLGWPVPREHGGHGHPPLTVVRLMEALGYGCRDNGLAFGLGTQMWGILNTLVHFGTPDQIARYVPGTVAGHLVAAFAINEETSGSDAFGIGATATRDGRDYVLDGEKTLVTFAPMADFTIVFARTDPSAGRWGISAFLVDADTPGYTAHPNEPKMGLRTVPFGRLTLEGCRVPEDRLLGKEGAGAGIFASSQGWEALIMAPQLGAMQRLMEECIDTARNRVRGGKPIGRHQAVSHRIADMKLHLETARLLLYRTAWLLENGRPTLMDAALTKIHLSEAFTQSSLAAIAIQGGAGYTVAAAVERNLRDAIGATLYSGTADIHRNIVSGLLGLKP